MWPPPTTPTVTTTTGEPIDAEEPEVVPYVWPLYPMYNFHQPYRTPTTMSYLYNHGRGGGFGHNFYAGGSSAGGTSGEIPDWTAPTAAPPTTPTPVPVPEPRPRGQGAGHRRQGGRRRFGPATRASTQPPTTPPPTTTTTTTNATPEQEETAGAADNALFPTGGNCFCSLLSVCPSGSGQRGGFCSNALTDFLGLRLIRCCYRPSFARRLGL